MAATEYHGQTRVADVIAADPSALARLVALDPRIADRDTVPADLTVQELARRCRVPLADVLAIAGAGPGGCGAVPAAEAGAGAAEPAPSWLLEIDPATAASLDVRPILAANGEPLGPVVELARRTEAGAVLIIDAPFDPQPLRRVLASQGFTTFGRALSPGHWRIWCRKQTPVPTLPAAPALRPSVQPAGQPVTLAGAGQRLLPESIPIRFFAVGLVANILAWAALIVAAPDVATYGGGPGMPLAAVHLLTAGVLLAVAFGASLQMLPVALARPAPPRWACEAIFALLALGLLLLIPGFADVDARLIAAGSGSLAAASLLYAATLSTILCPPAISRSSVGICG